MKTEKRDCTYVPFGNGRRGAAKRAAALLMVMCICGGGLQVWAAGTGTGGGSEEPDIRFALLSREESREGGLSLRESLSSRRSVRSFAAEALTREETGRLLWAGGGVRPDAVSGPSRTAPSAGAIYPIKLFLVAGEIEGLAPGLYRYLPQEHGLQRRKEGDYRQQLAAAALNQMWIAEAPAAIVLAGDPAAVARKYGSRGAERYLHLDAGAAAENILLETVAAGLGATPVGAFRDERLQELLDAEGLKPLLIIPVGVPR